MTYGLRFLCALDSSSPECDERGRLRRRSREEDRELLLLEDNFERERRQGARSRLRPRWGEALRDGMGTVP